MLGVYKCGGRRRESANKRYVTLAPPTTSPPNPPPLDVICDTGTEGRRRSVLEWILSIVPNLMMAQLTMNTKSSQEEEEEEEVGGGE